MRYCSWELVGLDGLCIEAADEEWFCPAAVLGFAHAIEAWVAAGVEIKTARFQLDELDEDTREVKA